MNKILKNTILGMLWVVGLVFAGCDAGLSPMVNILGAALIGISSYLSVERHAGGVKTRNRRLSELRTIKTHFPISSHP